MISKRDDTFRRVFERINPKDERTMFSEVASKYAWFDSWRDYPLDGKSQRGSYDRNQGVKALHLVTAWASEQRLVLGQVKVEEHSNEITAIPALLELLDLTG